MSTVLPPLAESLADIARRRLAQAEAADVDSHLEMVESTAALAQAVRMLLAHTGERAS